MSTHTTPTSRVRFSALNEDGKRYQDELFVYVDDEPAATIEKTGVQGWGAYAVHGRFRGRFESQRAAKAHILETATEWDRVGQL